MAAPRDLLTATLRFGQTLRQAGLPRTVSELMDAVRALEVVDLMDRQEVYMALRACLVASLSAGAPPPVCDGASVVFGVSAGVFTFCGVVAPGAGAGDGAPGASPCAFSSPGSRYSGPSHGIRKSKVRKSCGSDTGS